MGETRHETRHFKLHVQIDTDEISTVSAHRVISLR